MKKLLYLIAVIAILASCADPKTFTDNKGRKFTAEPYGWANAEDFKIDTVLYKPNVGNIIWDVILIETIIVPIWLTGWEFYEPVGLKTAEQYNKRH